MAMFLRSKNLSYPFEKLARQESYSHVPLAGKQCTVTWYMAESRIGLEEEDR